MEKGAVKLAPSILAADAATPSLAVLAGANVLVAGSSIFAEAGGVTAVMERLRTAINLGSEVTVTV